MSVSNEAPVLTTDRLVLRNHARSDFEAFAEMWTDPEVVRFISSPTWQECWGRLHGMVGHWGICGYGYWAVEDRVTGEYLGQIGLANFKRGIELGFEDCPEAGWVLNRSAKGRGLATEGVTAALSWAAENLAAREVHCIITVGHVASLRVAEKCGFIRAGTATFRDDEVEVLRRPSAGRGTIEF